MTTYTFVAEWLKSRTKTERGASLVEYALLVALIAVACIIAVKALSGGVQRTFNSTAGSL